MSKQFTISGCSMLTMCPTAPTRRCPSRLTGLLEAAWRYFDGVAATAPAQLRKGPRGGRRDRDAIVDHVREAERSYGRKAGARVPPRTPGSSSGRRSPRPCAPEILMAPWPVRYALRRIAWHVLDHAGEVADKSS